MELTQVKFDVFLRWIQAGRPSSDEARRLWTIAAFFGNSVELKKGLPSESAPAIDEEIVQELFTIATPHEAITLLDTDFGRSLAPESYERICSSLLNSSLDDYGMARLMWTAGGYLDLHPWAFRLPKDIAERLMDSSILDERLGGVRAHRHTEALDSEVVEWITRFLEHENWEDKWTGLSGIQRIVAVRGVQCFKMAAHDTITRFNRALDTIAKNDSDSDARSTARRFHELLRADIQ